MVICLTDVLSNKNKDLTSLFSWLLSWSTVPGSLKAGAGASRRQQGKGWLGPCHSVVWLGEMPPIGLGCLWFYSEIESCLLFWLDYDISFKVCAEGLRNLNASTVAMKREVCKWDSLVINRNLQWLQIMTKLGHLSSFWIFRKPLRYKQKPRVFHVLNWFWTKWCDYWRELCSDNLIWGWTLCVASILHKRIRKCKHSYFPDQIQMSQCLVHHIITVQFVLNEASFFSLSVLLGHIEVVKLLVAHGAEVTCKDKKSYTPLHAAASSGMISVVKYLLDLGVDVRKNKSDFFCCSCFKCSYLYSSTLLHASSGYSENRENISKYLHSYTFVVVVVLFCFTLFSL